MVRSSSSGIRTPGTPTSGGQTVPNIP
uniref:Uncharacterized protein n=1 Tax=Anopheles albimanus TaxID=7167 RepID=A0A182FXX5_ANOAL